jgi:hypothetical protein
MSKKSEFSRFFLGKPGTLFAKLLRAIIERSTINIFLKPLLNRCSASYELPPPGIRIFISLFFN